MSELQEFRVSKDQFYRSGRDSPLTRSQKIGFTGLAYFDEHPDLRIDAELAEPPNHDEITLETSTGDSQTYRRAGLVHFAVDGQPTQITLYAAEDADRFFVPFRDATSGHETYGAGRYLEVDPPVDGRVILDFNYAYNPYCAYNDQWSCPLPPLENWLAVPIRAGEKEFEGKISHHSG
jgi:uncharacterized protein (DUF1684 family)